MKCQEIRELMPDLAAGVSAATSETEQHLQLLRGMRREAGGIPQDHGAAG